MYVALDIGGTKMRAAQSRDGERFGEPLKKGTPQDFDEAMEALGGMVEEVSGGEKIDAAAGGIAGVFDREEGVLLASPNLPGWVGKPLKKTIEKRTGAPVHLDNDTVVVGMGEARSGAGFGFNIVAYITVSTGVGGARIVGGKPDARAFGFEPGHQIIDMRGLACPSGGAEGVHPHGAGHLEGYVSGTAVERRFGRKPREIPQSDPLWGELARFLAVGLNNTIVHWSPDIVVLGGSMMTGDPAIPLRLVEGELARINEIFPRLPALKKAELGDVGGLYGALAYLRLTRAGA